MGIDTRRNVDRSRMVEIPTHNDYLLWVRASDIVEVQMCRSDDPQDVYWYIQTVYRDPRGETFEEETGGMCEIKEECRERVEKMIAAINEALV